MRLSRLSRCCCCDLVLGGMILGGIGVIADFVYFMLITTILALHESFWNYMEDLVRNFPLDELTEIDKMEISTFDVKMTLGRAILGSIICFVILMFVSDGMLIYGSMHKRASFVFLWLIVEPVCISLYILMCFLNFHWIILIFLAEIIVIRLYNWACMVSLFLKLRKSAEPAAYGNVIEDLNNSQSLDMVEVP